jgi:hypothetical protein
LPRESLRGTYAHANCNADADCDATPTYSYAEADSDATATPDSLPAPHALARSWNSLCGNSRNKLASSRGGVKDVSREAL